jgi:hypothetical protein
MGVRNWNRFIYLLVLDMFLTRRALLPKVFPGDAKFFSSASESTFRFSIFNCERQLMPGDCADHSLQVVRSADGSPRVRAEQVIAGLRRSWATIASCQAVAPTPFWNRGGLLWGAGAKLADRIEGNEARIVALLTIGAGKFVSTAPLGRLVASEAAWRAGRIAEAATHIALLNLPQLAGSEAAYRLHLAAGFLDSALLTPGDLLRICDVRADAFVELRKYNPDQPRVPAGNPDGGRWTSGAAEGEASDAGDSTDRTALILPDGCEGEWAAAIKICLDLLALPNPPRSLTGGHTTIDGCAKGFVSARCGGNPV